MHNIEFIKRKNMLMCLLLSMLFILGMVLVIHRNEKQSPYENYEIGDVKIGYADYSELNIKIDNLVCKRLCDKYLIEYDPKKAEEYFLKKAKTDNQKKIIAITGIENYAKNNRLKYMENVLTDKITEKLLLTEYENSNTQIGSENIVEAKKEASEMIKAEIEKIKIEILDEILNRNS